MKLQSIIYAVTVAVMASCSGGNASTDNNSAKPVKIDTVRLSEANTVLQFPGKVKASALLYVRSNTLCAYIL